MNWCRIDIAALLPGQFPILDLCLSTAVVLLLPSLCGSVHVSQQLPWACPLSHWYCGGQGELTSHARSKLSVCGSWNYLNPGKTWLLIFVKQNNNWKGTWFCLWLWKSFNPLNSMGGEIAGMRTNRIFLEFSAAQSDWPEKSCMVLLPKQRRRLIRFVSKKSDFLYGQPRHPLVSA